MPLALCNDVHNPVSTVCNDVEKFQAKQVCKLYAILVVRLRLLIFVLFIIIGQVKRAPHWGVQSRFRVIYMCWSVGMSVVSKMRRRDCVTHTHAQSNFWAVKTDL